MVGFWEDVNRRRAEARDTLAYWLANPGQGPPGDRAARGIHEGWSRMATDRLGKYLPPDAAGGVIDAAGVANEGLSGALNWAAGHGFYGEAGYDQGDIDANRRGIAASEAGLRRDRSNEIFAREQANPPPEAFDERIGRLVLEEMMRRNGGR